MTTPPAGISEADWLATPESVRDLVCQLQVLHQENERLRQHSLPSVWSWLTCEGNLMAVAGLASERSLQWIRPSAGCVCKARSITSAT
jgi:hypothetical protein